MMLGTWLSRMCLDERRKEDWVTYYLLQAETTLVVWAMCFMSDVQSAKSMFATYRSKGRR